MMNDNEYVNRLLELSTEFGKLVAQDATLASKIPPGAAIVFQVAGESEFNRQAMTLAQQRHAKEPALQMIVVHVDGLAPLTSRLLNPHLEPASL